MGWDVNGWTLRGIGWLIICAIVALNAVLIIGLTGFHARPGETRRGVPGFLESQDSALRSS